MPLQSHISVTNQRHDRRRKLALCGDRAVICAFCVLLQGLNATIFSVVCGTAKHVFVCYNMHRYERYVLDLGKEDADKSA